MLLKPTVFAESAVIPETITAFPPVPVLTLPDEIPIADNDDPPTAKIETLLSVPFSVDVKSVTASLPRLKS